MKKQISKLEWFGNDADGLTVIDLLSTIMFVYFLTIKTIQLVLSLTYKENPELLNAWNHSMTEVNNFTEIVMIGYFGKKTIDTMTTKVGMFKNGTYNERNLKEVPDDSFSVSVEASMSSETSYIDEPEKGESKPHMSLIVEDDLVQASISPDMIFGARKAISNMVAKFDDKPEVKEEPATSSNIISISLPAKDR